MYVIEGSGINLLGRNWLNIIQLDWSKVSNSRKTFQINYEKTDASISPDIRGKLNVMLMKYKAIFEDRIGTMKGYKAKIHVKDNAIPKFAKARNVPFALEDSVNKELEKLEREGVLKTIPFSEWASPIVIVPKPDGQVRICGDFKRTINPNIESEIYPTPNNDEVFSKIQGGTKFSKIDLRQAYLQMELDEENHGD